jgi:hypothetical protein
MNFFTLGFSRGDFLRGEIFFNLHQEFFEEFWLFFSEINALAIFEKWMLAIFQPRNRTFVNVHTISLCIFVFFFNPLIFQGFSSLHLSPIF